MENPKIADFEKFRKDFRDRKANPGRKSEYDPMYNIRTQCDLLKLIPINWDATVIAGGKGLLDVTSFSDYKGWSQEYHDLNISSEYYETYEGMINSTFDGKLYLGDSIHSVAYRKLFHHRNVFIDITRKPIVDQIDGESTEMDVVVEENNAVAGDLNQVYEANAYHILFEKVRWKKPDGNWVGYSDLKVFNVSPEGEVKQLVNVFECTPFIPIIKDHAQLIFAGKKDRKLPEICIARSVDLGIYCDVPDVYNIFPKDEYVWEDGVRKRFQTLPELSMLECAAVCPVSVYGHIAKIVVNKEVGANNQHVSLLKGHMIAVDNAIGAEEYISNSLGAVLDKQMVKNSLKVCDCNCVVCVCMNECCVKCSVFVEMCGWGFLL